jgi:hypothetical protein
MQTDSHHLSDACLGASKGAIGTHSLPEDVELWITTVTPKWVNLSKVQTQ